MTVLQCSLYTHQYNSFWVSGPPPTSAAWKTWWSCFKLMCGVWGVSLWFNSRVGLQNVSHCSDIVNTQSKMPGSYLWGVLKTFYSYGVILDSPVHSKTTTVLFCALSALLIYVTQPSAPRVYYPVLYCFLHKCQRWITLKWSSGASSAVASNMRRMCASMIFCIHTGRKKSWMILSHRISVLENLNFNVLFNVFTLHQPLHGCLVVLFFLGPACPKEKKKEPPLDLHPRLIFI